MKIHKKLVIGTANFKKHYGLNPTSFFSKTKNFKRSIKYLSFKKLNTFDTATIYDSEKMFKEFSKSKFNFISKIQLKKKHKDFKILKKEISSTMQDLNKKKIYAILAHNPNFLLKKNGKRIFRNLKNLKKINICHKVGYSIYSPSDLNKLYKKFKPEVVQLPLNVFDQRMLDSGWIDFLKKKRVEIHARSIFLQGLLLRKKNTVPKKFLKSKNEFNNWFDWLKKNKISNLHACLQFIYSIKKVSKIVIGYENLAQLKEILKCKVKNDKKNFRSLKVSKIKLIDPRKW